MLTSVDNSTLEVSSRTRATLVITFHPVSTSIRHTVICSESGTSQTSSVKVSTYCADLFNYFEGYIAGKYYGYDEIAFDSSSSM